MAIWLFRGVATLLYRDVLLPNDDVCRVNDEQDVAYDDLDGQGEMVDVRIVGDDDGLAGDVLMRNDCDLFRASGGGKGARPLP